jgi:hypothetical protein
VAQGLNEHQFNEYILKQPNILIDKFSQYKLFEESFAEFGVRGPTLTGAGWEISDDIGVYCLNTALCSSGGVEGSDGNKLGDRRRLSIDTRTLHSWNLRSKARVKIMIMHHPFAWLTEWAEKELKTILHKDFSLCLSGHAHDQSVFYSIDKVNSLCECSAPPLFTKKTDDLGYSLIYISPDRGVTEIAYRQWTKHQSFVAGGIFSNTDDGRIRIINPEEKEDVVDRHLTRRLNEALMSFSSQPIVWADPVLCKFPEMDIDRDFKTGDKIVTSDLISNPKSTIIKAPPQFGLTCLALYLAREAWRVKKSFWLYLDAKNLKHYTSVVEKGVEAELSFFGREKQDIKCIILDSWTTDEKDSYKLLETLSTLFKDVPLIVMQTISDCNFLSDLGKSKCQEFDVLYLWALSRGHIRKVVSEYNDKKHIGDEDLVIKRVVSDLEVLNLHRTPLNCLTLLKVSEVDFDESPVNRTEVIRRILFLLFNVDDIPTYKTRPDLKDCEYVLGYFCEEIIRGNNYIFSREYFLGVLKEYCKKRFIDLEIEVVFDVLHRNNIIVKRGDLFCFKFAYWIYYFIAQRMYHDSDFANYILGEGRYTSFPEIIEFYTGIDRRRENALQVLIKDIEDSCEAVQKKCGIPDGLNPFRFAQWKPSPETLAQMESEISTGVQESNLPVAVKDRYADRMYDRSRPYDQSIRDIITDYSFERLIHTMKAGARALRNSDYADPDIKRQLLKKILRCWEQISKVLLILLPLLAERKEAVFDGVAIILFGPWGDTPEERFRSVLLELPNNIVFLCQDDLFSQKMGPLLIDQLVNEVDDLKKHELILLLIKQRPRGWKTQVQKYITSAHKNSFYLFDVYIRLRAQYRYSYASPRSLSDMEYLIKMAMAKHSTGVKSPGDKLIKKVPAKEVLPEREVD